MKKILTVFFLGALLFLTGCVTAPEIRYVTKIETKTVVLEPPSILLTPAKHIKPPDIKTYSTGTWDEKEKMLFEYINKLNTQIESFLIDRNAIGKWVVAQKKNLEDMEK